jgi:hypothetical protein
MHRYLEIRTITSTSTTVGSDLARHLLSRQHVGKTIIVCERPAIFMSVVRKYWFRLTRNLQNERSRTLNAEKILQLTYDITHMQRMNFAAKPFREYPRADVLFLAPDQLEQLPVNCTSLYLLEPIDKDQLRAVLAQLSDRALVIDYTHDRVVANAPLQPKYQLDQLVPEAWDRVEKFFAQHEINIHRLIEHPHSADADDGVLDRILSVSSQFMRVADDFLELLRLAQPLHTTNSQQQLYDLLAALNRKIYALTPGILSQQFIQSLADDEEQSMHDTATEDLALALAV